MGVVNPIRPAAQLVSLFTQLLSAQRRTVLRLQGVTIGAGSVAAGVVARRRNGRLTIAAHCSLECGVILDTFGGKIEIAPWVFLGPYTVVYGHGGVTIGEGTLIAMHCRILSSNHATAPLGTLIRSQADVLLPTKIGRDVWLGAGVTVLGGVTIGDGCIVGAGAVVTKDLPAGAIAYGVPAAIKGYRSGAGSGEKDQAHA
jgi:acetyltransferase-like isoleucine patch superfamily enzyme